LTIAGDYSNSGSFTDNSGTVYFSGSSKTLSGTMNTSATDFYNVVFNGGQYTFNANASTTNFTINSGATVVISSRVISIAGTLANSGTLTSNTGTIYFTGSDKTHTGTMYNSSSLGNVVIAGSGTTVLPQASTTNLTINSGSTLSAPSLLTIAGDYSNSGSFNANSGAVYISGSSQQTLSGAMTNSSAFYNLTILNTSGSDPDASPSVIFADHASTTNTFTAATANIKIRFTAGKIYQFTNINLNGTGGYVYLRSSSGGSAWKFWVSGTQYAVTYVDVKDSDASSPGSEIIADDGTNINSTGNTNWRFPVVFSVPAFYQRAAAFQSEDATATTSSPYTDVKIGERLRVKFQIDTDTGATSTPIFFLQYDKNDSNWATVTPQAEIRPAKSLAVKDKMVLGGPEIQDCQAGKTWHSGSLAYTGAGTTTSFSLSYEDTDRTEAINFPGNTCQEITFTIDTQNAQTNTTYNFRLATSSNSGITYIAIPQITTIATLSQFFSKGLASSTPTGTSTMPYIFDKNAYASTSLSDNSYDSIANEVLDTSPDLAFGSPVGMANDQVGWSVSSGDFNGDGYQDLLVGNGSSTLNKVYIVFGKAGFNATTTATADVTLNNPNGSNRDFFGYSVSSGDFNGDGYDDALIGAYRYPNGSDYGRAYIFYGSATWSGTDSTADVTLDNPNGSNSDFFGYRVSSGDFNGDGYDDALIGANGYPNYSNYGRAYIFYGSATWSGTDSTADVTLDNPNGSNSDNFGRSVSSGDFNGDGYDDALIGAYVYPNYSYYGRAYIFYGSATWSGTDSTADVTLDNPNGSNSDFFGYSVSSGDFNGDGYDDALIGAYVYPNYSAYGRAYIFYGSATWSGTDSTADVTLGNPNGSNGDNFGISVSSGDFNGDGYDDALIGAYRYPNGSNYGRAYIFYGSATWSGTDSTADVTLDNPNGSNSDYFGRSVSSGDFNGDGYDDALIGAYGYPNNSAYGRAYIFYGGRQKSASVSSADKNYEYPTNAPAYGGAKFGQSIATGDFNGDGILDMLVGNASSTLKQVYIFLGNNKSGNPATTTPIILQSPDSGITYFGYSVSSGDFNGDGYDDALIGAYGYPNGSYYGRAYIFYGSATWSGTDSTADVTLGNPNGSNLDYFGFSVSSGDFNGDGYDDALIGAYRYPNGSDYGRAYIFYGSATWSGTDSTADVTLDNPNGSNSDFFGYRVSSGDFNGDGYDDALIGANGYPNYSNYGRAYIFYGSATWSGTDSTADVTLDNPNGSNSDNFGRSVSSGDFNGDGYDDALIGAYGYPNYSFYGRAYIFYGSATWSGTDSTADVTLGNPNGSNGDFFGSSVSSGDFNGDGYDDALIGASGYPNNSNYGRAYIFYGSATWSGTDSTADVTLGNPNGSNGDYFGIRVSSGDFNGDGYDDALIGASYYDKGSLTDAGRVYLFNGSKSQLYPIFVFAEKNSNNSDNITVSWEGQSSISPKQKTVYLDVYNFNSLSWENKASNNSAASSTDFTLSAEITSSVSNYYSPTSYWVFARVYQDYGYATLKTDYADISFSAGAAGILIKSDHTSNQESNKFADAGSSLSNGELFRFKFSKAGDNVSVTGLTFRLYGIRGVSGITNAYLYSDDGDGVINGADAAVTGGGPVSGAITGSSGTISFPSLSETINGDKYYILKADISTLTATSEMSIALNAADITSNSSGSIGGTISPAYHVKMGGFRGGAAAVGGEVSFGVSTATGGTSNQPGETIGNEPGFFAPALATSTNWENYNNALSSDDNYAQSNTPSQTQDYSNFSFGVPAGNTITGIAVKIEASGSTAAGNIGVEFSYNGGNNFTSAGTTTATLTTSDKVYVLGGQGYTWGRSWTQAETGNAVFRLRLIANPSSNYVKVDAVQVKIYYQASGGGGGGGGEEPPI
jgi:hypothetical protein